MSAAAAIFMGVQGISQIQNARYQANLIDAQSRAAQDKAAFDQNTLEIEAEKERLNRAILANEKLRKTKKVMSENIASESASGLVFTGDVFQTVSLKNLSEELSVIHLEQALIQQRLKGQQAQLTLKTEFEKRTAKAKEKQIRTAGYLKAGSSFVSAYGIGSDAGWWDKHAKHIDSGSSPVFKANTPGNAAPIYTTTTYGTY
tara:strand:- start:456 stop:1061 length:606 start_codon:yes stop_codon:yes gene_type:complete